MDLTKNIQTSKASFLLQQSILNRNIDTTRPIQKRQEHQQQQQQQEHSISTPIKDQINNSSHLILADYI